MDKLDKEEREMILKELIESEDLEEVVKDEDDSEKSDGEDQNDGTFEDWADDEHEEPLELKSLFSNQIYPTVDELVEGDEKNFGFNIHIVAKNLVDSSSDKDKAVIMLVNFVRYSVKSAEQIDNNFVNSLLEDIEKRNFLEDEKYMMPVLLNDDLLYKLGEHIGLTLDDEDDV